MFGSIFLLYLLIMHAEVWDVDCSEHIVRLQVASVTKSKINLSWTGLSAMSFPSCTVQGDEPL